MDKIYKKMKKLDLLTIGDTVVDAFIRLKDAHIHCDLDREGCELCLRFGDKIPYESVNMIPATGNSSNVAIATSRLGLNTAFLTNLGDDQNGKDCLKILEKEKIDTTFVKIEKNKNTNYHYVLWYDNERTILVKHEEYDYDWPKIKELKEVDSPAWIYLSSLGENSLSFHAEIIKYLEKNPKTKLIFQPGTFQIKFGTESLKDVYARTEVFFSNVEEAKRILGISNNPFEEEEKINILKLSRGISALGPKMVFISDAERGAYFYQNDELWHIPVFPDTKPVLERTGAGDAFSGTITAGLVLGLSPLKAFAWGPINSRSVIKYIGPQKGLLKREELEKYLKKAPANYKPTKLN